jgi:hypothetical protein
MERRWTLAVVAAVLAGAASFRAAAVEDIAFVTEHLAEVPMDNRFATLPVWSGNPESGHSWSFAGQVGLSKTATGNLEVAGPMVSAAADRAISSRWSLGVFAFYDRLGFTGENDVRPLETPFAPETPFARPVLAQFDNLDGSMTHYGAGLDAALTGETGWLGHYRLVGGILWQRVELHDYRFDYVLLEGDDAGLAGQIDFDAGYTHVTPYFGVEFPRSGARWATAPHVLAAWPNPRYGVVGHITGPGFDLHGDTESAGEGKHFGDPWIAIGFDVTYLPARLTIDVGALVTQRLLEPVIHKGIDTNWVLSVQWRF